LKIIANHFEKLGGVFQYRRCAQLSVRKTRLNSLHQSIFRLRSLLLFCVIPAHLTARSVSVARVFPTTFSSAHMDLSLNASSPPYQINSMYFNALFVPKAI